MTVHAALDGEVAIELDELVKTDAANLYPVPLTDEVIVRCGFIKTDAFVYEHSSRKVELELDQKGLAQVTFHDHKKKIPVRSLHELQHYFWFYTNAELIYSHNLVY